MNGNPVCAASRAAARPCPAGAAMATSFKMGQGPGRGIETRKERSLSMSGGVKAGGGGERDLRLDFFRGLALICIFIDHVPGVWLAPFTIQFSGLFDAAEVFILISGYTAGLVYGRVLEDQGAVVASLQDLPSRLAALRRPRVPVHDLRGAGRQHGGRLHQPALRRGIPRRRFPQGAGAHGHHGADAQVPAGVHGYPAALHRAAVGVAAVHGGGAPAGLAGAGAVVRAVARGPVRQERRAHDLSRAWPVGSSTRSPGSSCSCRRLGWAGRGQRATPAG